MYAVGDKVIFKRWFMGKRERPLMGVITRVTNRGTYHVDTVRNAARGRDIQTIDNHIVTEREIISRA